MIDGYFFIIERKVVINDWVFFYNLLIFDYLKSIDD